MASLSVHYTRLAAPLATFVMSLGWFTSMPARGVYFSWFWHICGGCLLLFIWLSWPGTVHQSPNLCRYSMLVKDDMC